MVTTTNLGSLFVSGNVLPTTNEDHYSTVDQAIAIPTEAQVTTYDASSLGAQMVPHVGTMHRDAEEQAILDELAAAM